MTKANDNSNAPEARPLAGICSRTRRIILLSSALILMGLGDLDATLLHSQTLGLHELNPLAAAMLSRGMVAGLIALKLTSMALCVAILLFGRRHRIVEASAWAMALVMVALTFHWSAYNSHLHDEVSIEGRGADYLALGRELESAVDLADAP